MVLGPRCGRGPESERSSGKGGGSPRGIPLRHPREVFRARDGERSPGGGGEAERRKEPVSMEPLLLMPSFRKCFLNFQPLLGPGLGIGNQL